MNYYAHTAEDESDGILPECHWQSLAEHLRSVAELAKGFARPLGMEAEAELAGLLHDLGKYQPGFQHYLVHGHPRSPHAYIGAAVLLSKSSRLANVIASHHAGLHDWADLQPKLKEICEQRRPELRDCLTAMQTETRVAPPMVPAPGKEDKVLAELRIRLLFSALVDADYIDTEAFHLTVASKSNLRGNRPSLEELLKHLRNHLDGLQLSRKGTSLNDLRSCINHICAQTGETAAPGLFSLTVPTGGSKTLSSANFALNHAVKNGFKRVIYVLPYTSIIEQNGRVFAAIFGPQGVLEHYSLADWASDGTNIEHRLNKLAAENWDAPFIITTNVQFFESLFSHKTSSCRKLHRLMNSVVIFDECQTFPPDLLTPTLERLKALVALGRTSLVFCTATQPAFRRHAGFAEGFEPIMEIIPRDWKLHERKEFRRTKIHFRREAISLSSFCNELREQSQVLVIVNTRREAWEVFTTIRAEGVFHLSALMCPAHRRRVLARIKTRLKRPGTKCVVVSTQLIEAGVDLDFPKVYRAIAPLDSIIQAAGRCNREGRLPDAGDVIVFKLEDGSLPGGAYRKGADIANGILPDCLDGNFDPDVIYNYFQSLYQLSNRDKHNFQGLCADGCYRQIGKKYRWIESDTEFVLTNYSVVGKRFQTEVRDNQYAPITRQQVRQMARFCINLRKSHVEQELVSSTKLVRLPNGLVLTQESYDHEFGYHHFGEIEALII